MEPTIKDSGFGFWRRVRKPSIGNVKFQRDELFKAKLSHWDSSHCLSVYTGLQTAGRNQEIDPLSVRKESTDEYASDQDEGASICTRRARRLWRHFIGQILTSGKHGQPSVWREELRKLLEKLCPKVKKSWIPQNLGGQKVGVGQWLSLKGQMIARKGTDKDTWPEDLARSWF